MSFINKLFDSRKVKPPETRVVGEIKCFPEEFTLEITAANAEHVLENKDEKIGFSIPHYLVSLKTSASRMDAFLERNNIKRKLLQPDGKLPITTISGEGMQMPDDIHHATNALRDIGVIVSEDSFYEVIAKDTLMTNYRVTTTGANKQR